MENKMEKLNEWQIENTYSGILYEHMHTILENTEEIPAYAEKGIFPPWPKLMTISYKFERATENNQIQPSVKYSGRISTSFPVSGLFLRYQTTHKSGKIYLGFDEDLISLFIVNSKIRDIRRLRNIEQKPKIDQTFAFYNDRLIPNVIMDNEIREDDKTRYKVDQSMKSRDYVIRKIDSTREELTQLVSRHVKRRSFKESLDNCLTSLNNHKRFARHPLLVYHSGDITFLNPQSYKDFYEGR